MNAIDQLLSQFLSASSRLGDALWLMDDRAMLQYVSRPRAEGRGISRIMSPLSFITPHGSTAVIQVHGVMMQDPWYDDETSTPGITEATRLATADTQYDQILFDIASPGGSSAGILGLADAVEEAAAKKPVYAQSTGMIASGAYWLAAGAQKIYADRMDWIGSIGVRMDVLDASRWFANLGLERVAIDTGPLKSTGLFGTEVTPDQRAYMQGLVDETHTHFKAMVQRGRKMNDAEFAAVATGGVFPASTALRLNLIDGVQTLDKTLAAMPRRQTSNSQRSKTMSEQNTEPAAPKAATMRELKTAFPKSSAEWRESQIEAEATLQSAAVAYATHLESELEKSAAATAEAEKKAADAAAKNVAAKPGASAAPRRGNRLDAKSSDGVEADNSEAGAVDYYSEAKAYQEKHKVRWSEACRQIKKKYPEALQAFGGPK